MAASAVLPLARPATSASPTTGVLSLALGAEKSVDRAAVSGGDDSAAN
eukprot:CAMPEP_0168623490 /NCGR_PEP_ID=MMETSP0449_2-20121227/8856_1 /TAXON_ID=1082188 /ORGANISM="Strombidium rassoulzadegani, Strain ras09" /LENGTH=47 /DNA_ID= /DNA_START= /DNA_END= /DNA_ORIENTATION=